MALANVALTDTFDVWRVRTNQIIVSLSQNETATNGSFIAANTAGVIAASAFAKANSTLFSSNVYITTSDSTNAALTITQTGTGPALVVGNTADPNTSLIIIDANSRVGIGTNAPTSNLHVIGTANITNYLTVAGMNVTFAIASAFGRANSSLTVASDAFDQANSSLNVASDAFEKANASINLLTSNVVISTSDNSNSALRITQTGSGNALLVEDAANPDASPFVVANDGKVGIGLTSPLSQFHLRGAMTVDANTTVNHSFYAAGTGAYTNINLYAAAGNIVTPTRVANNSYLGFVNFGGYDGLTYQQTASIYGLAGTTSLGNLPTNIVFETNLTEQMRITSTGNVGIKQSNPSYTLDVGGSINAASLLVNGEPFVGGAKTFSINVGNSAANTFSIAHNLNKADIWISVRENSSGYFVYPDVRYTDANTISLEFATIPTSNQYYVSVLGG